MRQRLTAALLSCCAGACSSPLALLGALCRRRRGTATAAPLGGINAVRRRPGTTSAEIDSAIERRAGAARAGGAHRRAVVGARTAAQGTIEPHALALADRLVGDASAAGIGVIVTVDSTPCWDSSAPASLLRTCTPAQRHRGQRLAAARPVALRERLTAFLAQRYGARLAAIEVWNEPDQANQDYLAGPEKPQLMRRSCAPPIRRSSAPIRPCPSWRARSWAPTASSCARSTRPASGATTTGWRCTSTRSRWALVRSIHETQLAYGDTTPLWLDEFGWSSCWPRHRTQQEQACVTPQVQGTNTANVFRSLARTALRRRRRHLQAAGRRERRLRRAERLRRAQARLRAAGARTGRAVVGPPTRR